MEPHIVLLKFFSLYDLESNFWSSLPAFSFFGFVFYPLYLSSLPCRPPPLELSVWSKDSQTWVQSNHNFDPRVLRLFCQRLLVWRVEWLWDKGMEARKNFWHKTTGFYTKQRIKKIYILFEFFRVSPGDQPLTKKPLGPWVRDWSNQCWCERWNSPIVA